jgi:alkylation response protein AidB-like acyl-CoA dehydrogenase
VPDEPLTGDLSESELRARVRELVAGHAPRLPRRAGVRAPESEVELAALKAWGALLFERGVLGANWPPQWGGDPGWTPERGRLVEDELAALDAPDAPGMNPLAAHALLGFGTDAQKARFLPRMRSYQDLWCQLFSEPGAGSDLGSLQTRAVPDAGGWRVTGQKVWSTNAHWADWGFLLARTEPGRRSSGLTAFVLDMRAPGVTVRPLREMTGTSDFNEVFLDDVPVPADALLGEVGGGWRVATACLAEERALVGRWTRTLLGNLDHLVALCASDTAGDPAGYAARRAELARLAVRVVVCRAMIAEGAARERAGRAHGYEPMLAKLSFSELNLDMAGFGLSAQGPAGMLDGSDPAAGDGGRWQDEYLYARAWTIAGGSSEIMRNLIAERGLGLPRR